MKSPWILLPLVVGLVSHAQAAPPAPAAPAAPLTLNVDKSTLPNGMVVLLMEDHSIPMISLYIHYEVGSRNERPGITGVSHLFEHMMFNGSSRYEPKQFDRALESAGGYSNAYTSEDITVYHQTFPAAALPLVLDLESDRMQTLRLTSQNLEQERGIVKEERRVSTDNVPAGLMYEQLCAAAYVAHPYQWQVIGWMGDLNAITLDEAKAYYDTYYGPNNATMVVVGDFDTAAVKAQIEQSFGKIPARGDIKPVPNSEPEQRGERRVTLKGESALPAVMMGYKAVSVRDEDAPALEVLAQILAAGESSRLFQSLVYSGMAVEASAWMEARQDPTLFVFYLQPLPGHTTDEMEKAVYAILEEIKAGGVTDAELQKARNVLRADFVRSMTTIDSKADLLGVYEIKYGDYKELTRVLDRYDAVTVEDLKRVAAKYFVPDQRTVVTLEIPAEEKGAP